MLEILQKEVRMKENRQVFVNSVHIYLQSVFRALNENDVSLIQFYQNEL